MGRQAGYFDWITFFLLLLIATIGLVTLLSISPVYFKQQLIYLLVGMGLFFILSRIDFDIYQYIDKVMYVFCIVLLSLSYLGPNVRGATRWLEIGQFRFQPSELVKPVFLLCICIFLTKYPLTKIKNVFIQFFLFLVPFFLVFHQPDLGSSLVYLSMWLGLVWIGGISLWIPVVSAIIGVVFIPLSYHFLREYQKLRIHTFLNPMSDPQGAGYNAIQSMISVGSGQLIGRGFGRGTQSLLQFLPEHHTDFIFATFAEEFGFIGSIILLSLFFVLVSRLFKKAENYRHEPVVFLFTAGLGIQILTHVIINIGMNIGILPITGITLPLVSYGGSSLISLSMAFGIYASAIRKLST